MELELTNSDWEYEASENDQDRDAKITIAALGNEAAEDDTKYKNIKALANWAKDIWL